MKKNVVLVQAAVGAYRQGFLTAVSDLKESMVLYVGDTHFSRSVVTDVSFDSTINVKNHYVAGRRLLWQSGVLIPAWRATTVVIEFNPRIISSWWIALLRRLSGRRTLAWGHAWPRSGPASKTAIFRKWLSRCVDGLIAYTPDDAADMALYSRRPTWVAPNAIHRRDEPMPGDSSLRRCITYSGRLVQEKGVYELVDLFAEIASSENDLTLLIIGDGPERDGLEGYVAECGLDGKVRFAGVVTDTDELAYHYERSIISVSVGYIGLQLLQSLHFGVPVVFNIEAPNAPEAQWAGRLPGAHAVKRTEMAKAIRSLLDQEIDYEDIAKRCRASCSVEAMAEGFVGALHGGEEHAVEV